LCWLLGLAPGVGTRGGAVALGVVAREQLDAAVHRDGADGRPAHDVGDLADRAVVAVDAEQVGEEAFLGLVFVHGIPPKSDGQAS
jgi:hypothetical protein